MTAPHLGPGQVVAGKYTIRGLLGFTGEVATYQAHSAQGEVVLKLYDPAIGQRADLMAALEKAAADTAALPPDSVVRVIDSGYDLSTSAPFSVTEYLMIPSLARLVEAGPLPTDAVGRIVAGMSRALDAAHGRGLFHHALKPTNVFVGPAPDYAVQLTDFGASVVRSAVPTHEAYALSAPWWAPEQMQPGAALGPAADVFSTALVAFHALVGRSYWYSCQTNPPDLASWQQEIMSHRTLVSQRAGELGVGLNSAVDGVFTRALSPNPGDRPQSVREIANALLGVGHGVQASGYGGQASDQPARTMAFPEMDFPSADEGGGYGQPVQAQAGQVASVDPYAAQSGAAQSGSGSSADAPGLPPYPQPSQRPKKKSSGMLAIILGVGAAVVLGGGAVVYLFLRTPASETVASTTTGETPAETSGGDTTPASTSATGDTTPSATPTAEPSAETPAADNLVTVTIACDPSPCDKVEVAGEKVEIDKDGKATHQVEPGRVKIKLTKAGYAPFAETVTLGEDGLDKTFKMQRIVVRPPPRPPCGLFIKAPCN